MLSETGTLLRAEPSQHLMTEPSKRTARLAGILYLALGLPAVFSYQYLPKALIVRNDATATANNVLASEMLFRLGIASELVSTLAFLCLVVILYRLLHRVDKTQARLMVILVLVSVPISFLNVVNETAALALFRGGDFLSAFDRRQLEALGMLFLRLHSQGLFIAQVFWGLWLFPFGVLVMRSGFLPRLLGVLLIAACFGYLASSFTALVLPNYWQVVNWFTIALGGAGELSTTLWLLIKGVKPIAAPGDHLRESHSLS